MNHSVHADAIIILGGGLETRPFEAARLYQQNYARKILIMNVRLSAPTQLGITLPEKDLTRQMLLKLGVPASDVVSLGAEVATTFDESIAVRDWTRTHAIKSLIIATGYVPYTPCLLAVQEAIAIGQACRSLWNPLLHATILLPIGGATKTSLIAFESEVIIRLLQAPILN